MGALCVVVACFCNTKPSHASSVYVSSISMCCLSRLINWASFSLQHRSCIMRCACALSYGRFGSNLRSFALCMRLVISSAPCPLTCVIRHALPMLSCGSCRAPSAHISTPTASATRDRPWVCNRASLTTPALHQSCGTSPPWAPAPPPKKNADRHIEGQRPTCAKVNKDLEEVWEGAWCANGEPSKGGGRS